MKRYRVDRRGPAELGLIALIGLTLLSGCPQRRKEDTSEAAAPGCQKDTDCKGARVCVNGTCQTPAQRPQAPPPPPPPKPAPPPPPAYPDPNTVAYGPDGLPAVIPPPGSSPPTITEWNAVTREITVRGSSALGCDTKMIREWLRVSCTLNGRHSPFDVRSTRTEGQQAYVFKTAGQVTSAVVQVVRGKDYRASFVWDTRGRRWNAELTVSWPSANPRPEISFRKTR